MKKSKADMERLERAVNFLLECSFSPSERKGLTSGTSEECSEGSKL